MKKPRPHRPKNWAETLGRSLSLAAYRALSRRKIQSDIPEIPARPDGEILWAHATSETRFSALCDLGRRLKIQRPGLGLLVSFDPARFIPEPEAGDGCDWIAGLDSDHPDAAQRFLTQWAPDLCLWAGGILMPNLIAAASEQGIPMILLDIGESDFPSRRHKWFPDLNRASLLCFEAIMVTNGAAARSLQRIGVPAERITVTDRLRNSATPPPCPENEPAAIAADLSGRPVWLAAHAMLAEFDPILAAHRAALRLAHRLLLVIILADPADAPLLVAKLSGTGLRYAAWEPGDPIEDSTQVLISHDPADLGIWYRVAPLSFVASSLSPGAGGRSPLEAAATGSAVLYGPNVDNHLESYSRLAAAGAARSVHDAQSLGAAVIQLIAPDYAAAMALAGWQVVTEGARLTDRLIDRIQDMLDSREPPNAGA